ncbi:hypothetical protein AAG747_03070 [Rapidithrix thailandica]|uniref:DUF5018 domain-containing protein n=1 Tax=Rapidithrix thailandica TaxID=413964 RepID=A0AAW9S571_9BACT
MKLFSKIKAAGLILLWIFTSCSTNEILRELPYGNINEFTVNLEDEIIYAEITETELIINWPYNIEIPTKIAPSIRISENATIQPASEEAIDPTQDIVYKVIAEDGSERSYSLKIDYLQPILKIEEIATPLEASFKHDYVISGEGLSKNKDQNKVFLVSEDGSKEYPLKIDEVYAYNDNGYADKIKVRMPKVEDVQAGKYKVKITLGNRSDVSDNVYFDLKDLKLPYITIPENMISEKEGVRCMVLDSWEQHVLNGDNLNTLNASQIFFLWKASNGQGTASSEISIVDENTIMFTKSPWADANKLYQKAYIEYQNDVSVYLRDENGEFVGIYFE